MLVRTEEVQHICSLRSVELATSIKGGVRKEDIFLLRSWREQVRGSGLCSGVATLKTRIRTGDVTTLCCWDWPSGLLGLYLKLRYGVSLFLVLSKSESERIWTGVLRNLLIDGADRIIDPDDDPGRVTNISSHLLLRPKPRVLMLENSTSMTGAFRSAISLVDNLQDYEYVWCIPRSSVLQSQIQKQGLKAYFLPFLELRRSLSSLLYAPQLLLNSARVWFICKMNRVQIVHVNDLYNLTGILCKVLGLRIPVVYHVRLLKSSYIGQIYWPLVTLLKVWADRIVVVSEAVAKDVGRSSKLRLIYDCVTELTKPVRVGSEGSTVTIVYFANYIQGKGHDLAFEIYRQSRRYDSRLRLKFIGRYESESQYFQFLQSLADQSGFKDDVQFLGECSCVEDVFLGGDIFLNCSLSESFSRSTLEAIQNGVPTLVYDSGGIRELFDDELRNFCVIEFNDVETAVERVLQLAKNASLRNEIAAKAQVYVEKKFSRKKFTNEIRELYGELLGSLS